MAGVAILLAAAVASNPSLGKAAGACRSPEPGPAIIVGVDGLKDRAGILRLELYPGNDHDFLADDNVLVQAGKTFARVDMPLPLSGPVSMCIRVPRAGTYSLSLLHDRDGNLKFSASTDGIGFPGDPRLGWSKPKAAAASVSAGPGLTDVRIRMNYRHGLFMRPLVNR